MRKMPRSRRSRDDLQRHDQRHSCKTEALEKHVKTVTVRAEALATTEAGFFKTLIERTEPERARSAAEPAKHRHPFHAMKTVQRRKRKQAHAWSTKFVVFSHIMSESEEVSFDVRPNAVGKKRPCPSMRGSVPKAPSRAAHLMQQWPDGTKHSRRV